MPRRKPKVPLSGKPQRRKVRKEGRVYLSDLKDLLLNSDGFTQGDRVLVVAEDTQLKDYSRHIAKNSVVEVHSHPSKLCNIEGDKQVDCEDRLDYRLVNAKGRPYGLHLGLPSKFCVLKTLASVVRQQLIMKSQHYDFSVPNFTDAFRNSVHALYGDEAALVPANKRTLVLVFDLETTGLDIDVDHIMQIGCVAMVYDPTEGFGQETWEFMELVHTDRIVPLEVIKLTNINNQKLDEKGLPLEKVLRNYSDWFASLKATQGAEAVWFAAHNGAAFDMPVLWNRIRASGMESPFMTAGVPLVDAIVDTYRISCYMEGLKDVKKSLGSLFKFLLQEAPEGLHDALEDCRALAKVIKSPLFATRWSTAPIALPLDDLSAEYSLLLDLHDAAFAKLMV